MPKAARIEDPHTSPARDPGPTPHVGGPVTTGYGTVLIEWKPAARVGDRAACTGAGAVDVIVEGSRSVLIGDSPAARNTDEMLHGGKITSGAESVFIGDENPDGRPIPQEAERRVLARDEDYVLAYDLTTMDRRISDGLFIFKEDEDA